MTRSVHRSGAPPLACQPHDRSPCWGWRLIPTASVAAAVPANPVSTGTSTRSMPSATPPTAAIPGLGHPPPLAVIHLAMVHGAIYDAVNAIDGGHEPYLIGLPSTPGASKAAAVATAAHGVLLSLPPLPPDSADPMRASVAELYRLYILEIPGARPRPRGSRSAGPRLPP